MGTKIKATKGGRIEAGLSQFEVKPRKEKWIRTLFRNVLHMVNIKKFY